MKLNKRQMAKAFEVTPQAIDGWIKRGLPYTPGAPGVPAIFDWDTIEDYLLRYGRFSGYQDPHDVVEAAYHRAVAILEDRQPATP